MKRTKKHRNIPRSETQPLKRALRACILGTVGALCIGTMAIALISLFLLSFDHPHTYILPLGLFCVYFSAFVGGFICALADREHAFFCGAAVGGALFLLIWATFSLLDPILSVDGAGLIALPLKAAIIPLPILGSLFGSKKPSRKRKRPKNF